MITCLTKLSGNCDTNTPLKCRVLHRRRTGHANGYNSDVTRCSLPPPSPDTVGCRKHRIGCDPPSGHARLDAAQQMSTSSPNQAKEQDHDTKPLWNYVTKIKSVGGADSLSYKASMTIFFGVDYADGTSEKVTAIYCVREEYSKMLNAEGEALKDSSGKSCDDDVKEQCEKKPRVAQNSTANLCGKQLLKQKKDDSESEEGSKENLHSCESLKRSSYKQSQPCRKGEERKD
ncbi:hypothetical protein JHK82_055727 [Glycine max]|nr:hypothetical protein JHK82_055727 [Glycine max]